MNRFKKKQNRKLEEGRKVWVELGGVREVNMIKSTLYEVFKEIKYY